MLSDAIDFVRPCRSSPFRVSEVTSSEEEDRRWEMAKLCGEDFGWARSDLVASAEQPPQCPFVGAFDWYCTLTRINIPDRSSDILRQWSIGHRS